MSPAELPDLFSVEMKGEGVTPCWAMLLIMSNGKTNRFNKLEYPGNYFLRHTAVKPPPALKSKIWPWVDEWLARYDASIVLGRQAQHCY
jgi:hypothetical protein